MEEKHVSHMGSKTMAGTQHDSHMGSQSMEKQPTGSKHSCSKVSSTATGLWQDILDFFLLAQEDFCLVWPLWSHHFLAFALALDMAFLGWPLPLLVWPLPFFFLDWPLAAGFLAAALALAFWSWFWSQSSWSMVPPWRRESLHGCPHSWQVALLATLRVNTQLLTRALLLCTGCNQFWCTAFRSAQGCPRVHAVAAKTWFTAAFATYRHSTIEFKTPKTHQLTPRQA